MNPYFKESYPTKNPYSYKGIALPKDSSTSANKSQSEQPNLTPAKEAIKETLSAWDTERVIQDSLKAYERINSIWNDSRFWIAASIILGMMIILVITVFQAQYAQTQQLAAIFSGWVTSIIAFYFMGQTTSQAQSQIKESTMSQSKAENKTEFYLKKLDRIKDTIEMQETFYKDKEMAIPRDAWDKIKKIITDTA